MTPRSAQRESKSLKTFFIYAGIVLFFIILSLVIKSFFLIQQSRFDSNNEFILAIAHDEKVQELALLNPAEKSVTLIKLQGAEVGRSSLEKILGIIPDAYVTSSFDLPSSDISDTIRAIAFKYHSLKTNLTIFDVAGLFFASQKATFNNQVEKEVVLAKNMEENVQVVKNLFIDDRIFSENVSIQIINASSIPGMGQRLERVLTNLGCNVVAVSSSRKEENFSKIQYFGTETYTLNKLKKLLDFSVEKIEKKSIATIVITIGSDNTNSSNFK